MSNRSKMAATASRGYVPKGAGVQENALTKMLEGVKEAANKANQSKAQGNSADEFTLPKPDFQDLGGTEIVWTWKTAKCYIKANFHKESKKYSVLVEDISMNKSALHAMTAEQSKELGEILCAAYQWESQWQANAGIYLANNGELPHDLFEDDELGGESINRG